MFILAFIHFSYQQTHQTKRSNAQLYTLVSKLQAFNTSNVLNHSKLMDNRGLVL